MKYVLLFWLVFLLNLIYSIVGANVFQFDSKGESAGFILSCNSLYLIPYGMILLFTKLALANYRKQQAKKYQTDFSILPVQYILYVVPGIALFGVCDLLFSTLPEAVSHGNSMHLNAVSMILGLAFGASRSFYLIRKQFHRRITKND